jgi:hypothetical protein
VRRLSASEILLQHQGYKGQLIRPQTSAPSKDSLFGPTALVTGFRPPPPSDALLTASAQQFARRTSKELRLMGIKRPARELFLRAVGAAGAGIAAPAQGSDTREVGRSESAAKGERAEEASAQEADGDSAMGGAVDSAEDVAGLAEQLMGEREHSRALQGQLQALSEAEAAAVAAGRQREAKLVQELRALSHHARQTEDELDRTRQELSETWSVLLHGCAKADRPATGT